MRILCVFQNVARELVNVFTGIFNDIIISPLNVLVCTTLKHVSFFMKRLLQGVRYIGKREGDKKSKSIYTYGIYFHILTCVSIHVFLNSFYLTPLYHYMIHLSLIMIHLSLIYYYCVRFFAVDLFFFFILFSRLMIGLFASDNEVVFYVSLVSRRARHINCTMVEIFP